MDKKRILILLASEYPFGKGDVFVDTEMKAIRDEFDEVHILPVDYDPRSGGKPYFSPVNTFVHTYDARKSISSYFVFFRKTFRKLFWNEKKAIRRYFKEGFSVQKLKVILGSYLKVMRILDEIERIVKGEKESDVFLYSFWINEGVVASLLLRNQNPEFSNIKVFCRGCGWDIYFERHPGHYLPWRKFIFENSDAIFCVSRHGMAYLKNRFPDIDTSRISYAYLGVKSLNSSNGLPDFEKKTFGILSCSMLVPVKRIDLLIEALAIVKEIRIKWVHIGGGPLLEEIRIKAKKVLENCENIEYEIPGHIHLDERDAHFASGDFQLFVNVSSSEGIPVSVMEAISCAMPVMATSVGGNPEIAEQGSNGILLSENPTPLEIASALKSFFLLPVNQKKMMASASYTLWMEKFNAEKNYQKFINGILNM